MTLTDEKYLQAIRIAASSENGFMNVYRHVATGHIKDDDCSSLTHYSTVAKAQEELIAELFGVPLYEVQHDVLAELIR